MMMMMMQNVMGPACGGLQFVNTIVTISESCIMCIVIKKNKIKKIKKVNRQNVLTS